MLENIIRLPRDPHRETQQLLPWYVTGQLEAADRALVEAHLGGCAECQAALRLEQTLKREVAALPVEAEQAWASMLIRLKAEPTRRALTLRPWLAALGRRTGRPLRQAGPWLGWASAAALLLFLLGGSFSSLQERSPRYHALASASSGPVGDVVLIFRPDTSEAAMRQTLRDIGARLVDGPTAADAYVLYVPPSGRARALQRLRASREVVLAQPVDAGGQP
jgi:hypothetical protein